jgi:hypothetical protein
MPVKKNSKKITSNDDLDLMGSIDEEAAGGVSKDEESAADSLFQNYFTPETPEDPDEDADETFLDAADREHDALAEDLNKADQYQKSVLRENKQAADSGVDPNYYFCVVFVSEQQRDAFIEQSGWAKYGGKRFLNGVMMAHEMGLELPDAYLATEAKPDRSLAEFVRKE